MKLYQDYKKLFKIVFLIILFLLPVVFSYAQTAEEVRNKISQKDADIAALEKEIASYQAELDTIGAQKNSLSKSLKELDVTKKKLTADIAVTQNKIDKTNLTIQNLSFDINVKQTSIDNNVKAITAGIRSTNEYEQKSLVESVLSDDDFGAIWNDIDNIVTVRDKIREEVSSLKEVKGQLEDTRQTTIDAKNELSKLKSQLSDQQKVVIQNTNDKAKLLAQTKNSEANYQKLIKEQEAKKLAFEKELRDYESQLQFILDPSKLPGAGVLSWPLSDIFVTQEFGAKTGPHRTYANGHSGTDFRARTPLPVFAMADGVVMGTGNTDIACPGASFGQWVLIQYTNGLSSTYGHLSLIKVSQGQKVSRGETVAYTGSTGRVTGPHLHVSLYAASGVKVQTVPSISCPNHILTQPIAPINAYLDPMYYLPPYKH